MKKMLISLVIEGDEEILKDLKGQVMETCGRYIASVSTNIIEEPKKEINVITTDDNEKNELKTRINAIYGAKVIQPTKMFIGVCGRGDI